MESGGLCETHLAGLSGSDTTEGTETEDANPGFDTGGTALATAESRQVFADRLEEAGLDTQRFIDVHDGEKRSTDHTQLAPDDNQLSGNYGVYGGSGAGKDTGWILVDIDVDDYDGERAPDWIPDTFAVASPHTDGDSGGHFYVALPTGAADALEDAVGTANPNPPWGEIRVHNQYCVGPGSQLDGCSKDWCDDCAHDDGGYYRIKHDHPIAQMETEEFVAALQEDMPDREHEVEYPESSSHEFDDIDLGDYEPEVTGRDETTGNVRDILHAIERIDARHVAEDTIVHRWNREATTSGRYEAFVPTWGKSANGTANIVNDEIWQDTGGGGYGNVVTMALIDAGELRPQTASPRHSGELFWKGVEYLRELGYSIPEYERDSVAAESVAILPETPEVLHSSSTWNWRHAGAERDGLTISAVRDRTKDAIADALGHGDQVLVESLPSAGKTTGTVKAVAETGHPITYLAPRREVMRDVAEKARAEGLDVYTLPAFTRHCPTANGDHGDDWQDRVMGWYRRGASPKDIHANAENELGYPLPCQGHDGEECPYTSMWRFDPEDYDVLIGHYNHGHKSTVTTGRTVVFDEFPAGSYETTLSANLEASVTAFLQRESQVPYSDYADLMENRTDEQRRADALLWFTEQEPEDDPYIVFDTDYAHAKAPLAVFTLLAASKTDLGNGWERCKLPDGGVGLFNRETNEIRLLQTPALEYTSGVIALDGTPTRRMWELSLGTRLNHRQVLSDEERREYIRDVLDLNLVQTSEYMKPYNNPDYVNLREDRALLEGIEKQHGKRATVITSLAAEKQYLEEDILDENRDRFEHYGNLKSSNEFGQDRLGAVIGSQHYGDGYIKKWSAYAGHAVERNDGKGVDLSYGEFGDKIYQHMTHHETLQAAMRFGRDGNGATVYVHTAALPDWVPVAGQGRVLKVWSDGMKQVLDAANGLGSWRTKEIADHPDVSIGERQVRDHLKTLTKRGYVTRETEGRGFVWQDDGLHEVSATGEVELDVVEDEDVVAEVARKSTYTWEFRNSPDEPAESSSDPPSAGVDDTADVLTDGGRDDPPPG